MDVQKYTLITKCQQQGLVWNVDKSHLSGSVNIMPRRPNTKPTFIYWLTDTRPEAMAEGWPQGKPFYCGKTVGDPNRRLMDHVCRARCYPNRKISKILNTCGRKNIRIVVMAVVSLGDDWAAAERRWIAQIRLTNPDSANVGLGGEGPAGMIHSAETRAKMSTIQSNRSAEWNRRISLGKMGIKNTPEACAKMSASQRASDATAEQIRKLAKLNKGRIKSSETLAKLSASLRASYIANPRPRGGKRGPYNLVGPRKKRSPQACLNMVAAQQHRREKERARLAVDVTSVSMRFHAHVVP